MKDKCLKKNVIPKIRSCKRNPTCKCFGHETVLYIDWQFSVFPHPQYTYLYSASHVINLFRYRWFHGCCPIPTLCVVHIRDWTLTGQCLLVVSMACWMQVMTSSCTNIISIIIITMIIIIISPYFDDTAKLCRWMCELLFQFELSAIYLIFPNKNTAFFHYHILLVTSRCHPQTRHHLHYHLSSSWGVSSCYFTVVAE